MKKILIIIGITLIVILGSLIILPFAFQGKIKEIAKTQANEMLNAKIDFEDVTLSFIKNFPNATVSVKGLTLSGTDVFEKDTLLQSKDISVTVNIMSLFGNKGYDIKKIEINETKIHAKILKDGKANWDIMKPSETEETAANEDNISSFRLKLQKINLNQVDLLYEDLQSDMSVDIKNLKGTLKGDMTADLTNLETKANAETITFVMSKIPYLNKVNLTTDMVLNADFINQKYTFQKSAFTLNAIKGTIDGWVSLPDSLTTEMDIKIDAPEIQFKDILSLIPAVYANEFKDLKADGNVKFSAFAKGVMKGESYPAFDLLLNVNNGKFQYPSLPKSLNDIAVDAHVSSPGGDLDKILVDISKFHFNLGGNPFDIALKISHLMTDPDLDLKANGKLNLNMVKEVYPLEKGTELNGELDANLAFAGAMSNIEKGAYDKFRASGMLSLKDMLYKSQDMPDVLINSAAFTFNPRYAELGKSEIKIGKNDISASGKLENYIPYMLKNETIKGSLDITSNYLNLNDFMKEPENSSSSGTSDSPILAFEIPKNIDFTMNANLKQVIYDKIDMKNMMGNIIIRDGKAEMKNLSMNALGGDMKVNGYYSTAKDPKQPEVNFGLDMKNVSFAQTFKAFDFVQKLAPIFENMMGNYSVNMNLTTSLTENMTPILAGLTSNGLLISNDVSVSDVPALTALAGALKNNDLKKINVKDLKIPFVINEGRVKTQPFDMNVGTTKMNLSGSTGLDQTIDYIAKVSLPSSLTKGTVNNVNVRIGGTFTSPKISLDTKDLAQQAISSIAGSLIKDKDGNPVDANAEIDKQADAIRAQAKATGEKLMQEAEKQGQALIDQANKTTNPLAKIAAVKAAEASAAKLKSEAQKQADNLNTEAEKQIQSLSSSAKKVTQ